MNRIVLVHRDSLSCESIVRRMPNGELLMVCQCKGPTEPHPDNRVFFFHSGDNGATWSAPKSIYPEDGNAVYQTEVMVHDGVVSVFLTIHTGRFLNWNCIVMKSYDSGYTWENAGAPPHLPTFTFVRGMIVLKNGNLVIPYQHYPISDEINAELVAKLGKTGPVWQSCIDHCENGILLSTDNGKTYSRHLGAKIPMPADRWVWSEPSVAELSDGTIAMLLRRDGSGCLWRSDSKDGGKSWSEIYATDIPNPTNKAHLVPIPDGRIALLHTPKPPL